MTIFDEIAQVKRLRETGSALAQYAATLVGGQFLKKGRDWVYGPDNFVTFTIQHKRSQNIVITLRGRPKEFEQSNELLLRPGRATYSRCTVDNPRQLRAAANYIGRAYELNRCGRSRDIRRPVTVEG